MPRKIILLIMTLLILPPLFAQKGWQKSLVNGELQYVPGNLPANKVFKLVVSPPEARAGSTQAEWFPAKVKTLQASLGKTLKDWKFNTEKDGSLSANNTFQDGFGTKYSISYQGGNLDGERFYIARLISSNDLILLMKYAFQVEGVLKEARQALLNGELQSAETPQPPPAEAAASKTNPEAPELPADLSKMTAKERRQEIQRRIRTAANQGVRDEQVEKIFVWQGLDVLVGGMDTDVHVLFRDGTIYTDCTTPLNDLNIEVSRKLEPQKWSTWRREPSGEYAYYRVNRKGEGAWKILEGKEPLKAASGERPDNIFWRFAGSAMFGSHKASIRLLPDGRFELFSSSMVSGDMTGGGAGSYTGAASTSDKEGTHSASVIVGATVGGGSSSTVRDGSKNTGTYRLDGWAIEMVHDNGYVHREQFFFDEPDKSGIVLEDDAYWLRNED
ncbi:MAG: hypothetical protein KDI06_06855 [Calditrichaeota bacterium]|nr:hypothetical protein [Calditrichota bacterium]HQU71449.1 hypothetical protein [Calditrichia bacterium]